MKLCSYEHDGRTRYGVVHHDGGIVDLSARLGDRYPTLLKLVEAGAIDAVRAHLDVPRSDHPADGVAYLPLFEEQVAVHCVGLNYAAHTAEANQEQPDFPRTFFKTRAALVGHGQAFEMPTLSPNSTSRASSAS